MEFGKRKGRSGLPARERRRGARQPSDIVAEILIPGMKSVRCRVTDLSTEGARLELTSSFGLPFEFEMRVSRQTYRVQLVRRGPRWAAIKFKP